MKNNIYHTFSSDFAAEDYIRYGKNQDVRLYVGKDEELKYSFEFRGICSPKRINSSNVISVSQTKYNEEIILRFSLQKDELLEFFSTFCDDLVASVQTATSDEVAYKILCDRYNSWKLLFKNRVNPLNENEIMGLIGELLFMKDYLFPKKGYEEALGSWGGPEKTHKDFAYDNAWYEVKTKHYGKDTVRISSIEQLDSSIDGALVVYSLEKMTPQFNGVTLNKLVSEILLELANPKLKDEFTAYLNMYGYSFLSEYDDFVYMVKECKMFSVKSDEFPRLKRDVMPKSVVNAQYDLRVSDLEKYLIL